MWARRRRKVRLHMVDNQPSIEGFLLSREAGHYRLAVAELLEAPGRTHEVGEVMVPARRVAFYQLLGDGS